MSIRRHPPAIVEGFSRRLRETMAELRVSQAELSERLSASPSFISSVLRGLKLPGSEFLLSIRQALGVSVDWLLIGEGERFGNPIDAGVLQSLALQVEVIRRAARYPEPEIAALLREFLPQAGFAAPTEAPSAERLAEVARALVVSGDSYAVAISLYNRVVLRVPTAQRATALSEELLAYFESQRPPSILGALAPARASETGDDRINWDTHPLPAGRKVGDVLDPPRLKRRSKGTK